jgi:excisionase family DNA binding protein
MPDKLLTHDEVANDWLNVPSQTLYKWESDRTAPRSFKLGRNRRYRVEDVQAWLDAKASKPGVSA